MISQELLSEILDKVVLYIEPELLSFNEVCYSDEYDMPFHVNVYELAHNCKEYAMKNDYCVNSFTDYNGTWFSYANNVIDGIAKQFSAETEYEAIFKACQFILDEKDQINKE